MARIHIFADEAGNFDFSRGKGASAYFILTTVILEDFSVGDMLLALRRQLEWEGTEQFTPDFHATAEAQHVRDRVFVALGAARFRVDATIIPKNKVRPDIAQNEIYFYRLAWFLHLKQLAPELIEPGDELLVLASSIGIKKKRTAFHDAVKGVVTRVTTTAQFRTAFWSCASDPCLWLADYCCWAIQRRWESNDARSHALIKDKIATEYEHFTRSQKTYY